MNMNGEILAIGNELTSGRIINSTSYFAASHLFAAGHKVVAMATVGDDPKHIGEALLKAIRRADFVVVTGGLGSTTDDITSEAVSDALDLPQTLYPDVLDLIKECEAFQEMPAMEKMAWLPSGAEVLKPGGKISGFMLVYAQKPIFFLPGVPTQMRELMLDRVIPRLATWQENSFSLVHQKLFKVFGLEEAVINDRLAHIEEEGDHVLIGYYPMGAEVHVSLTVRGESAGQADSLFTEMAAKISSALSDVIYGYNNETMSSVTGALLAQKGLSLGCAESCTGGLMSHMVTGVAGSSQYFRGGVVAYANGVKEQILGVSSQTLTGSGTVSEKTALEMAQGVRGVTNADIGLSITGVAGPGGGTEEKPVGTVCFGLVSETKRAGYTFHFSGTRAMVQGAAATMGLDLVRRHLLGL